MKYEDYKKFLSPALAKVTDIIMASGKGSYLTDVNGDVYLDFVQGIAVNAFGHCHPKVVEAIQKQAGNLIDGSFNLVSYPSTLELSKKLTSLTPEGLDVVFFSNGGAEANDGAIKLARNYTKRPAIIAMRGSFHGRSLGATSITGSNSKYRKNQEPLLPSVYFTPYPTCFRCPYNTTSDKCKLECLRELQWLFDYLVYPENVAAVIMEPVLGEGGYVVPPQKYVDGLSKMLKEHGILLIFDEIQSGYGRTGKMFASEHFGIVPDIMTLGKAIAGGLPMSAIVSTKEIMDSWQPGMHGTTFGGNPVCAASALAVLDLIEEENILERVVEQGDYLKSRLMDMKEKYSIIGDVRGLGLMLAAEFVNPEDNSPSSDYLNKVKDYCLEKKMLTLSCGVYGNGFRFATPLNITREDLDKGLAIFEDAVKSATK